MPAMQMSNCGIVIRKAKDFADHGSLFVVRGCTPRPGERIGLRIGEDGCIRFRGDVQLTPGAPPFIVIRPVGE